MARNVITKHKNNPASINYNAFIKDLPSNLSDDKKKDLARGILMVCNRENKEALYIVNTAGRVIPIAMTCEGELPQNVEAAIAESISSLSQEMHDYVDETVGERIEDSLIEYDAIVVESGTNLYNTIIEYVDNGFSETSSRIDTEKSELEAEIAELKSTVSALTEYISTLKFSDHVLIQENAYMALLDGQRIKINENGYIVDDSDSRYEFIEYSDDVYYCIPENAPAPDTGSSIDISGDTIYVEGEIEEGEIEGEFTIVLDDTIDVSGSTIVIQEGSTPQSPSGEADIDGDTKTTLLDDETEANDGVLELSNSFDIDGDNNALIIL